MEDTLNTDMPTELIENMNIDQIGMSINNPDFIKAAEIRVDTTKKIKKMALSNTNRNDWVDFSGKPYLNSGGCKKIARLFGISWKIKENKKILDSETGHYFYLVTCDFWVSKNEKEKITEYGTKSTHNKFFGTVKGEQKPPSEIDETNIQKSAMTNCVGRGIKSILGLDNIEWNEINAYMKPDKQINQNNVASVTYANGGQGGGKISEAQRKRLYAIYKGKKITDDQMKDYLLTEYNLESSRDIEKGKMYDEICAWAEKQ